MYCCDGARPAAIAVRCVLPGRDHVLKRLHFPPQPMRLAVRIVERSVDREDRDLQLRQID
jgi:hypothetical protein